MTDAPRTSRRNAVAFGVVLVVLSFAVASIIYFQPQNVRAPLVVAYVAAASFGVAGLMVIATALGASRVTRWLAVATTAALVFPAFWLAFGKGERECTLHVPFLELSSEVVCRAAFGVGAVLGVGILAVFVHYAVSHKSGA